MSQRDADAQILEQFLRTMAPPAALTSAYRQRVVLASVDARARILQRRRSRRTLAACALCLTLIAGPICLGLFSVAYSPSVVADKAAESLPSVGVTVKPTVDGFESALIQSQWSMRVQTWASAQTAAAP
ncbi:MAG: hypothetical protein U0872_01335 [Planctomycetaceae bacterium]